MDLIEVMELYIRLLKYRNYNIREQVDVVDIEVTETIETCDKTLEIVAQDLAYRIEQR